MAEPVDIAHLREEYAKAMRFPKDTCTSPVPLRVVDVGELAMEAFPALLDELEQLRARLSGLPQIDVEWRRDAPCGYPHVDIRHKGMRAAGWVVPDGLEDRLPSLFDGLECPPNPFLPPVDEERAEGDG